MACVCPAIITKANAKENPGEFICLSTTMRAKAKSNLQIFMCNRFRTDGTFKDGYWCRSKRGRWGRRNSWAIVTPQFSYVQLLHNFCAIVLENVKVKFFFLRVWPFHSHALFILSAKFGRLLWDCVEIAQNRRQTKCTEHASKKIRPSRRLELFWRAGTIPMLEKTLWE